MVQKGPIIYSDLVHRMSWSRKKLERCHPKDFGTSGNWRTQYRLQSCGTHFCASSGSPLPPFVRNRFVAVYFWPIFDRQFINFILLFLHQCGEYCIVIGSRSTHFEILGCAIDLIDGAQCKYKRKPGFFLTFSCELVGRLNILGFPVNLSGDWLFPNLECWKLYTTHTPGPLNRW